MFFGGKKKESKDTGIIFIVVMDELVKVDGVVGWHSIPKVMNGVSSV